MIERQVGAPRRLRLPGGKWRPGREIEVRRGRVFGVGLSRTGTSSLTDALELLGYRAVHFPSDPVSRAEVMAFLARGGQSLRLSLLDRVDAIADVPVCASFEALDAAYPESRFIFTTRAREAWLDSCAAFWPSTVEPFLSVHARDSEGDYVRALCQRVFGGEAFDRTRFAQAYDAYHERVDRYFLTRGADLQRVDICVGEGWGPICEFLGRPVPKLPFPWVRPGRQPQL